MTREDAISLLSQVNRILVNSNSWLENTHEPLNIAFGMAIKALEQGLILDKARAEIADLADYDAYTDVQQAFNDGLWKAVEIIDKHKVKNEV